MSTILTAVHHTEHPEAGWGMARWAAGLVNDGDTVAMDASSAVLAMASFLADRRELVVLTNGIELGRLLARNPSNRVVLTGNVLRADGLSVVGPFYGPAVRGVRPATAFISCEGFSLAAGLTETDADVAAVKRQMVAAAGSAVALIESGKFGRVCQAPFIRADELAHIFSDDALEPHWVEQVQDASIVLTLCHPMRQVEP